jgi:hypothetical protein
MGKILFLEEEGDGEDYFASQPTTRRACWDVYPRPRPRDEAPPIIPEMRAAGLPERQIHRSKERKKERTKVGNNNIAVAVEQQVLELEVAVHDLFLVDVPGRLVR